MNPFYWLYVAFALWLVQQVNDLVNSVINRAYVPKMFWLSAATSFGSGLAMFYFLYAFTTEFGEALAGVINFLQRVTGQ